MADHLLTHSPAGIAPPPPRPSPDTLPIVERVSVIRDPHPQALAVFGWTREERGDSARSGDGQIGLAEIQGRPAMVGAAVTVQTPAGK